MKILILLLASTSLFAQKEYPKRIIYDNDTLIAITEKNLDSINTNYINHDFLKIEADSLRKDKTELQQSVKDRDRVIIRLQATEMFWQNALNKSKGVNDALRVDLKTAKATIRRKNIIIYGSGSLVLVGLGTSLYFAFAN